MEKVKALIVEDEKPGRDLLINYLGDHLNIEVLDYADNGFDAVKKINDLQPDLLFLDIQIPKLTGFEVLDLVEKMPAVIFTTAYNEFALKAFEINAVDYLLKPFVQALLHQACLSVHSFVSQVPLSSVAACHGGRVGLRQPTFPRQRRYGREVPPARRFGPNFWPV